VLGVLGLALAWEVLLNVALNAGLASALVHGATPHTRLEWRHGWWVWPGRVHLRGFSLWERDNEAEWRIDAERVEAHVSLAALLSRHVRAHDVTAHGLRFWLASAPPLETGPRPPEPQPLRVDLERVALRDVREVNWERLRYVGPGAVDGSLRVVAGQRLTLDMEHLRLAGGLVEARGERVATLEEVSGALVLDNLHPPLGNAHRLEGQVDVHAALFDLGWLGALWGGANKGRPRGGAGSLDARLRFHEGVLAPGSRVEARGAELEVALGPARVRAPWSVQGEVAQTPDQGPRGELTVRLAPVRVEGRVGTVAELPSVALTLHATWRAPGDPTPLLEQRVDISRSHPIDLRMLNAWMGHTLRIDSGKATVSGSDTPGPVREPHRLNLLVRTDLVEARWAGQTRMLGQATLDIDARRVALREKSFELEGTHLHLEHVSADLKHMQVRAWSGTFSLPSATLDLEPVSLETRFTSTFASSDPFVALLTAEKKLPTFLSPLFKARDLKVTGRLRLSDAGIQVRDLHATAEGGLELRGRVDSGKGVTHALILATAGGVTGAIEVRPGHTHLQLGNAQRWFEERLHAPVR